MPCVVVVCVQSMHGVKFLAVVLVVLQVGVGVPCLLRIRGAEGIVVCCLLHRTVFIGLLPIATVMFGTAVW